MVSPSHNNRIFGPGSSIYHLYTRHIKVTNLRTQYLVQINKQMQSTCAHQNLLHPVGQPDCSLPQKLGTVKTPWLYDHTGSALTAGRYRETNAFNSRLCFLSESISPVMLQNHLKEKRSLNQTTNKKKTLRKHLAQLSHETNVCRFPSYRLLNIFILIMGYFPDGG